MTIGSCNFGSPDFATDEQRQETIQNASFDRVFLLNIDGYNYFKTFLEKHLDTIIQFRQRLNGENPHDNCCSFFQGNPRYDISNVPDFLKKDIDSIFHHVVADRIESFQLCKDREIKMTVRREGGENGLSISHVLIWNSKMEKDNAYIANKDTLISENCIYRLGMTEDHGH